MYVLTMGFTMIPPLSDRSNLAGRPPLKVVGNEKVGGSRRWHMIDIGLGPW